jgi:TPR repeat protein
MKSFTDRNDAHACYASPDSTCQNHLHLLRYSHVGTDSSVKLQLHYSLKLNMGTPLRIFVFTILITHVMCSRALAIYTEPQPLSLLSKDTLSTNWITSARAVLYPKFQTNNLTFQQTTNLICQESQRGNIAAEALWGVALLASTPQGQTNEGVKMLRHSAELGYVPAMFQLALLCEDGKYLPKDYGEAFRWFAQASSKGDPHAEFNLGACYHYGRGTTQDLSAAAHWYQRSADQTNYLAMRSLGYLFMEGLGVEKNLDKAKYWSERAASEGGNRRAMYNLGIIYSRDFPDTNSMRKSFEWHKKSAELEDPLGCLALSVFYRAGWGVIQTNLDTVRYWQSKAAALGSTEAQCREADAYRTGDGVPRDINTAVAWYRKATAKNHPWALYNLALYYLEDRTNRASLMVANDFMLKAAQLGHREAQRRLAMSSFYGEIASSDFESGKKWLFKSAESGWPKSEFILFQLYYDGVPPATNCPSFPKDRNQSLLWLRRAAEHDHLMAQATLAVKLIMGKEMNQDKVQAEKLLRHSAERGSGRAQNDLGFAIFDSEIADHDLVEAAMWCKLALGSTEEPDVPRRARVNFNRIAFQLTESQMLEVERRVKDFHPLPAPQPNPLVEGWEKHPLYRHEDGQLLANPVAEADR